MKINRIKKKFRKQYRNHKNILITSYIKIKKMRITKLFQVILTLFFGRFFSISIYESFIEIIPDLIADPKSVYSILKGILRFKMKILILL